MFEGSMDLPRELVVKVLKSAQSPEDAADLLAEYGERRRKEWQRGLDIEKIQHDATKKIVALQKVKICNHEYTRYHGDPSGGSDSSEECLICGRYIR
jgi:heme oxygenase